MERVRLIFEGISEIVGGNGLAVIVLTDQEHTRALSIVCDETMKVQISSRISANPRYNNLYPEVLGKILSDLTDMERFEILIHDVTDGEYKTTVMNTDTSEAYNIRLSDAVLLSIISEIPIYIDVNLMKKQGSIYTGHSDRMAIPINSITTDRLKDELEKAITEENYRLASLIKDELNNRK